MKYSRNKKMIGILGGMGPYATLMFSKNILDLTDADKDWDHIRTVTDNNVNIPSRSRALLFDEDSPLDGMIDSCIKLANYPVDAIYIPCNSAGFWVDQVQRAIKIPIINIVNVATDTIIKNYKVNKITTLGGMVPYQTDLYSNSAKLFGVKHIKVSEKLQKRVIDIIEAVKKSGNTFELRESFSILLHDAIRETSANGVILACTEFSEFCDIEASVPVVDSSQALAQHAVDFAEGNKQIKLNTEKIKSFWNSRAQLQEDSRLGELQTTMLTSDESEAIKKWELEKSNMLRVIEPYLSKDGSMMELGCGLGRWTRVLSSYVNSIEAFDYSNSFIENAKAISIKEKINNVNFFCSNVEDINPDKQYDYIVSIALLHYLDELQFKKFIEVIKSNLIKGGVAILRESFGYQKRFEMHGYYSDVLTEEYHAVYRTTEEIIESFGESFSIIENKMTLAPTDKKPETCQRILLLRKESESIN
jgi:aspartate racemase